MDNNSPQTNPNPEVAELRAYVHDLEQRIQNASFLLCDWDGYYDPETRKGNTVELAKLVEDAFRILQGRSWRSTEEIEGIQAQGGE